MSQPFLHLEGIPLLFAALCLGSLLVALTAELLRRPRWTLAPLYALRAAAFAALLMMLSGFWASFWDEEPFPKEAVLLKDVSLSMALLDAKAKSGFDALEAAAKSAAAKVPGLKLHVIEFASEASPSDKAAVDCGPASTALGDAILEACRRHPGASIVLSSDGCSNSGIPPAMAVSLLKACGGSLHALLPPALEASSGFDLQVSEPLPPASWASSGAKRFRGVLERQGEPKAASAEAVLKIDGAKVASSSVSLASPLASLETALPAALSLKEGWHEFEISVSPLPGELSSLNNSAKGVFNVPSCEKAMALWDRAGPELSAMLPALESRYLNFELRYASAFSAMNPDEQRSALASCALLVLGNVPPETFHPKAKELIASRVASAKISLLLLSPACFKAWLEDPVLGKLMPASSISLKPPPDGVFRLDFSEGSLKAALPLRGLVEAFPRSPDAVAMRASAEGRLPIPAVLASGRVAMACFSGSWRWRLGQDRKAALAFLPFWESFLAAHDGMGSGRFKLSLLQGRVKLDSGSFSFQLSDPDGLAKAPVLLREAQPKDLLAAKFSSSGKGLYAASLQFKSPGVHWFYASSRGDPETRSNRIPLVVEGDSLEASSFSSPAAKLERLAFLSKGVLVREASDAAFAPVFNAPPRTAMTMKDGRRELLRDSLLALLAVALLASEWALRRWEAANG